MKLYGQQNGLSLRKTFIFVIPCAILLFSVVRLRGTAQQPVSSSPQPVTPTPPTVTSTPQQKYVTPTPLEVDKDPYLLSDEFVQRPSFEQVIKKATIRIRQAEQTGNKSSNELRYVRGYAHYSVGNFEEARSDLNSLPESVHPSGWKLPSEIRADMARQEKFIPQNHFDVSIRGKKVFRIYATKQKSKLKQQTIDGLQKAYDLIPPLVGATPQEVLRVLIFDTYNDYTKYVASTGHMDYADWRYGAGGYNGFVFILQGKPGTNQILGNPLNHIVHEFVHTCVSRCYFVPIKLFGVKQGMPDWMNEGVAEYFTGLVIAMYAEENDREVRAAHKQGALLSYDDLSNKFYSHTNTAFNSKGNASLSYRQAEHLLRHTLSSRSLTTSDMIRFLKQAGDTQDVPAAFLHVFGVTMEQAYNTWRQHLDRTM